MRFLIGLLISACLSVVAMGAQTQKAGDTGSIKGKVRIESGSAQAGVQVAARQGDRDVAQTTTDRKGDFTLKNLAPGIYSLTFRKPGLSVGTIDNVEVRAGKVRTLADRLILKADEGSLAFVRGSVFNAAGRSIPGARIAIARITAEGNAKKIDERITSETGEFIFRLAPDAATYRVTAKISGAEPVSKDVSVDGAAIYRLALTITPSAPAPK
jgi:hypothetical protein